MEGLIRNSGPAGARHSRAGRRICRAPHPDREDRSAPTRYRWALCIRAESDLYREYGPWAGYSRSFGELDRAGPVPCGLRDILFRGDTGRRTVPEKNLRSPIRRILPKRTAASFPVDAVAGSGEESIRLETGTR